MYHRTTDLPPYAILALSVIIVKIDNQFFLLSWLPVINTGTHEGLFGMDFRGKLKPKNTKEYENYVYIVLEKYICTTKYQKTCSLAGTS